MLVPLKKTGGRNNQGKMTMRYIGGGHKKKYRIIDFKRNKFGVDAKVVSIEYDQTEQRLLLSFNTPTVKSVTSSLPLV